MSAEECEDDQQQGQVKYRIDTRTNTSIVQDGNEAVPLAQTLANTKLPFPYEVLPPSVRGLRDCARYMVQNLLMKEEAASEQLTPEDEDCLDDGFVICDLNVIRQKLLAWHKLFPLVKPFYAIKCNPDPMVAKTLVLAVDSRTSTTTVGTTATADNVDPSSVSNVGFDCASLPEIRTALEAFSESGESTTSQLIPCNHIVYANPQRAEKDLEIALSLSSPSSRIGMNNITALTFDGVEELYKVHEIYHKLQLLLEDEEQDDEEQEVDGEPAATAAAKRRIRQPNPPPDMILRICVPDKNSTVPLGEKFGVSPIESEIRPLAEVAAHQLNLQIIGISFHCGSGNHDPDAYKVAIQLAHDAAAVVNDVYSKKEATSNNKTGSGNNDNVCWLLDIGGGYPGYDGIGADKNRFSGRSSSSEAISSMANGDDEKEEETTETAAKIASVVVPLLEEMYPNREEVQVVAEPGRFFVEAAFALCSRIYRTKVVEEERLDDNNGSLQKQQHRHYYIAQGVRSLFKDCVLCGESFIPIPFRPDSNNDGDKTTDEDGKKILCTVHGPSGDEADVVCRNHLLPPLEVGDWLLFDRMGAYTLSISARSCKPPIRYVVGGGGGDDL